MTDETPTCSCHGPGVTCKLPATKDDGLCDWCRAAKELVR